MLNYTGLPIDLAPQRLVDSLQRGVNILVVLSSELSEFWRDFAREFDVDFDDRGHALIDHFSYDTHLDDGSHTTVVLPLADSPTPFISAATQAGPPVLYRGAAHSLGRLPMLNRVLAARSTSYSYESKLGSLSETPAEDLCLAGSKIGVVSAFQARNNARVTFVGSQDLFSDEMATASVACADGTLCAAMPLREYLLQADMTRHRVDSFAQALALRQCCIHQRSLALDFRALGRNARCFLVADEALGFERARDVSRARRNGE